MFHTQDRERLQQHLETALESGRWIVGVWWIGNGPNPDTGKMEERIFQELDVRRWATADFPPVVGLLKQRLTEIATNPNMVDAPTADETPAGVEATP